MYAVLPDEHIKIILDYIARHSEIEEETILSYFLILLLILN
ncbi:hypothetical protein [Treponema sp.]